MVCVSISNGRPEKAQSTIAVIAYGTSPGSRNSTRAASHTATSSSSTAGVKVRSLVHSATAVSRKPATSASPKPKSISCPCHSSGGSELAGSRPRCRKVVQSSGPALAKPEAHRNSGRNGCCNSGVTCDTGAGLETVLMRCCPGRAVEFWQWRASRREYFFQVGKIGFVQAQGLARIVTDFRHCLAVAARHLDDHVRRREAQVVAQVRADAETHADAAMEVLEDAQGLVHVERIGEYQRLAERVHAHLVVMRQQLFAASEGVAGILAHAVEELAEIQVEIPQEGVDADHVAQRDAEVAAVFLRPGLQRRSGSTFAWLARSPTP